jgi:CRISPR-associated protein Cas2
VQAVYLVCYDIADPKRLRRVHELTLDHGARLQFSVYQCELSRMQLASFKAALAEVIHHTEDQVLFVHLGPREPLTYHRFEYLGRAYVAPQRRSVVV